MSATRSFDRAIDGIGSMQAFKGLVENPLVMLG